MANVPGLAPVQNDLSIAPERLPGRAQVDDRLPDPPPLRPVAQQINTFHRFQDPGLGRLADSLAALVPHIYQYGDVQRHEEEQNGAGKAAQALYGKTPEEQRQILAENPDIQGPVAQRYGRALVGQAGGDAFGTEVRQAYATKFDKDNGNFDQWINEQVRSVLDKNKDPTFAKSFVAQVRPTVEALRQEHTKYLAERQITDQNNLLYGSFQATMNKAVETNAAPEQSLAAIRQTMATTETIARRTPQEQEQILLQVFQRSIEGLKDAPDYEKRYRMLEGMLNAKTKDPRTGQERSLLDDQTVGGAAHEVLAKAGQIFAKRDEMDHSTEVSRLSDLAHRADPKFAEERDKFVRDHPRWVSAEGVERWNNTFAAAQRKAAEDLAKQRAEQAEQSQKTGILSAHALPALVSGNGFDMQPKTYVAKDGTQTVYEVDDQRKDATEILQRQIDQRHAGWQQDPEKAHAKLTEEVQLYGQNGLKNKSWEDQLKNGPAAATTTTAAGGDISPALTKTYDLYRNLRAQSPTLLAKHLDDRSQRFFEIARVAQEAGLTMDPKQALQLAARATQDKEWDRAMPEQSRRDTTDQARRALTGFAGFGGLANTTNSDEVVGKVVENAWVLHKALGVPMDKAIEQAAPGVKATYAKINGNAVFVGSREVPKNFEDLAGKYVEQYWEKNKAELEKMHVSKGDLTLMGVNGTSNWSIIPRGMPASIGFGASFSIPQLYQVQQQEKAKADRAAADAQAHRYDPLLQIGNPDKGGLVVGPLFGSGATQAQQEAVKDAARARYREQEKASSGTGASVKDVLGADVSRLDKAQSGKRTTLFKSGVEIPSITRDPSPDEPLSEAWRKK